MDKTNGITEDPEVMQLDLSNAKRPPSFVSLYINNTRFGFTKWDFQMICGRVSITTDKTQSPIEELAVIAMSPQHAKAVFNAFKQSLEGYEAEHGEIIISESKPPAKEGEKSVSPAKSKKVLRTE
jgi:hypothetical protein